MGTRRSKFFHFHTDFENNVQNDRLTHLLGSWHRLPLAGNPGSTTVNWPFKVHFLRSMLSSQLVQRLTAYRVLWKEGTSIMPIIRTQSFTVVLSAKRMYFIIFLEDWTKNRIKGDISYLMEILLGLMWESSLLMISFTQNLDAWGFKDSSLKRFTFSYSKIVHWHF